LDCPPETNATVSNTAAIGMILLPYFNLSPDYAQHHNISSLDTSGAA